MSSSPLQGITVLDLTRLLPGPYASMVLSDLGARVIKVESPSAPDILRFPEPHLDGSNVAFSTLNRNKESLVVELTRPEGAEVVARLASRCDVLLTSTRPGFLDKLGLGHATLSSTNPGLITCALRGYSDRSPDGHKGGHDINFLALSGLGHAIRDNVGRPVLPDVQLGDIAGSLNAVVAIMAALIARGGSGNGKGQEMEVSITDSCSSFTVLLEAAAVMGMSSGAFQNGPLSGRSPAYRYYRCADDRWLALGAIEAKYQRRIRELLRENSSGGALADEEAWPDDLFFGWASAEGASREMERLFASKPRDEWVDLFANLDACVTPVLDAKEALQHSGRYRALRDSSNEMIRQPAASLEDNFPSARQDLPAASAGAHSLSILREIGYAPAAIESFLASGVVRTS